MFQKRLSLTYDNYQEGESASSEGNLCAKQMVLADQTSGVKLEDCKWNK